MQEAFWNGLFDTRWEDAPLGCEAIRLIFSSTLSRIGIGLLSKTRPPHPGPGSEPSGNHDAPASLLPGRPRAAPFVPLPWVPTAPAVAYRFARPAREQHPCREQSLRQAHPGCLPVLPLPEVLIPAPCAGVLQDDTEMAKLSATK